MASLVLVPIPASSQSGADRIDYECPSCREPRVWAAITETVAVQIGVNLFDRWVLGQTTQNVGLDSWRRNLREGWEFDDNHFSTNQFDHPYSGNINFNAARSNGFDYWSSIPFAALGSFIWEYFGETNRPALNDFISTTVGGVALGELTFQLSTLVLDNEATGRRRFWLEMAALGINPARGANRIFFGDWSRVGPNPPDRRPEGLRGWMNAGARIVKGGSGLDEGQVQAFVGLDFIRGDLFLEPYRKPFDVFRFSAQVNAAENRLISRLSTYGRLYGTRLHRSEDPRHILLVSQNYDYTNTDAYRVGGQSIDVGVVSRFELGRRLRLQTSLAGKVVVFAAVNSEFKDGPNRDYDFGPGLGLSLSAGLRHDGAEIARLGYGAQWIHNVNGLAGNHLLHETVADVAVPVGHGLSLGAQAFFYARHSSYRTFPSVSEDAPQIQAYLRWWLR